MARKLSRRHIITGEIVTCEALHVGGAGDSPETDMPFAVDGRNRFIIPGTGVTGALRAWVADHYDDRTASGLFGFQEKDDGAASIVLVEDCVVQDPHSVELWDGVGIDREWGSAAAHIKFDRAVLPRGTRLSLTIIAEWTGGPCDPHNQAVLGHLLQALVNGDVTFGGGTSRGQGGVRLEVERLLLDEQDWSRKQGVLAFLAGTSPQVRHAGVIPHLIGNIADAEPRSPGRIDIMVSWRPDGPVMTKAAIDGDAVDILPFVSAVGQQFVKLALPGSGLKGAFRERAERIVRTLRGVDSAQRPGAAPRKRHLEQVKEPLVRSLFGMPRAKAKKSTANQDPDSRRDGRSAVRVETCYSEDKLREAAWNAIATAPSDTGQQERRGHSPLYDAIAKADGASSWLDPTAPGTRRFEQAHHVAIDRWLGSAAEHFLYSALEPWDITWPAIRLRVDLSRLQHDDRSQDQAPEAIALLLLVLRDFSKGNLPIGFGANRGFGSVKVESISFDVQGSDFSWLDGVELSDGDLRGLPADGLAVLQDAWTSWIERTKGANRDAA